MSRLGIQAVLLSNWSNTSVGNFIEVAGQYGGPSLDIGFAPFFHKANPFGNAGTIISQLKSKRLKFIVHLSFHQHDQLDNETIKQRAAITFEKFVKLYLGKVDISISPRLEDEWSTPQYTEALTIPQQLSQSDIP